MSKNSEPSFNLSKKERLKLSLLAEQDAISEEEYPKLGSSFDRDNLLSEVFSKHPIKMRQYQRKKKPSKAAKRKSKKKGCGCK